MPISNSILQGLTVTQGVDITLAITDPALPPTGSKKIWLNSQTRTLFISIGTNSILDWIPLSISANWDAIANKPTIFPSDWDAIANKPDLTPDVATILGKIVVQDGEVLCTSDNVIFED